MKAIEFLKNKLQEETLTYFDKRTDKHMIDYVADAWMNDASNSQHRFIDIQEHLPAARKILDMASGCGTFVFYGLLNGYDVYGIDPEEWKMEFLKLKSFEYGYPLNWLEKFHLGVGENLSFSDNSFDCVSTYQTLEHVQDVKKCLEEMIRVTKKKGGLHIMCPDYRSTYEAHYRLPWLPYFPRKAAKYYLKLLKRPTSGLDTIQYVTLPAIKKILSEIEAHSDKTLTIVDLNKKSFQSALSKRKISFLSQLYPLYRLFLYFKTVFRQELSINIFVHIK